MFHILLIYFSNFAILFLSIKSITVKKKKKKKYLMVIVLIGIQLEEIEPQELLLAINYILKKSM